MFERITAFILLLLTQALNCFAQDGSEYQKCIYRIEASDCLHQPTNRILTGFTIKGIRGLFTALHGVVDARGIGALCEATNKTLSRLQIREVDVDRDVALLDTPELDGSNLPGLEQTSFGKGQDPGTIRVWGHPYGIKLNPTVIMLRSPELVGLDSLLEPESMASLIDRKSPVYNQRVVSIQGPVLPGHSGAPVLDSRNRVFAIANGGLKSGYASIAWAMPMDQIKLSKNPSGIATLRDLEPEAVFFFGSDVETLDPNIRSDRLLASLASGNTKDLFLLQRSGIEASEVEEALARKREGSNRSIARLFFESTKNDPHAADWLKAMLNNGLNPNSTRPDPYYEQEAILIDALAAGNAPMVLTLLKAGASPHPYQDLFLTGYSIPQFIFPYIYLAKNERLTKEEKLQIAKAYEKSGAAIARIEPGIPNQKNITDQLNSVENLFDSSEDLLGLSLKETAPTLKETDSPIAQAATKGTKFDWSKFTREIPTKVEAGPDCDLPFRSFEVRNLIGVYFEKAYFLGVAQDFYPQYALIEVSRDMSIWHVYIFIEPQAGMGLAKPNEDGYRPDRAWRRYNMTYNPGKQQMRVMDFYTYKTSRNR